MPQVQNRLAYQPAANEMACLDDIKTKEGMRLWNIAYPLVLKQVRNFDSRPTKEEIITIRRYATKHGVELLCGNGPASE